MGIFQICAIWFDTTRGRVLGIIAMAAPLNSTGSATILTLGTNVSGFIDDKPGTLKADIVPGICYIVFGIPAVIGTAMILLTGKVDAETLTAK